MTSLSDRQHCIALIDESVVSGASLYKACSVIEAHHKTYRRWVNAGAIKADGRPSAQRPEPGNKLTIEERDLIVSISNEEQYKALPPSQIVPKLADRGIYIASESSFHRVLKAANQLQHRGKALAPKKRSKPNSYQALKPNEVWSWGITFLKSTIVGCFFRLYMMIDIYSRKIVGWEVHETESAEFAAALINRACLAEGACRTGLVLHSDNGGPMKGATMLAKLQWLGVVPSFSRPSVSDDNPYSESLFKTLKYTPAYPSKPFEDLQAARKWVHTFVGWYNEEHCHSGIGFVTPGSRHRGEDAAILAARKKVYVAAKASHPERWSGDIKRLSATKGVWLNPDDEISEINQIEEKVA
jgi:putative transposase